LRSVSGREFARLAEARGWKLLRINGSHNIYGKDGSRVCLTIVIHGAADLKRGLCPHLAKLAKLAGIEDLLS
jgi:predicted RNA binding protein YcfA (HicA-like mRNA interferase family)